MTWSMNVSCHLFRQADRAPKAWTFRIDLSTTLYSAFLLCHPSTLNGTDIPQPRLLRLPAHWVCILEIIKIISRGIARRLRRPSLLALEVRTLCGSLRLPSSSPSNSARLGIERTRLIPAWWVIGLCSADHLAKAVDRGDDKHITVVVEAADTASSSKSTGILSYSEQVDISSSGLREARHTIVPRICLSQSARQFLLGLFTIMFLASVNEV